MLNRMTSFMAIALMAGAISAGAGALPEGEIDLVVSFHTDLGEHPEGVAVDKKGNVFVSMAFLGEVWKVTPWGDISVFYSGLDASGFGILGLAVDSPGNVFVVVASTNPSTQGVYRIGRDGTTAERMPGTEVLFFPDGLAFDKRGNLYVTEAHEGAIYRVPHKSAAELWLQHPLLEGTGMLYGYVRVGANGIQYWRNSLIVANTEQYLLVRVPILPDGSAGEPEVLYDAHLPGWPLGWFVPDGLALDVRGNVYVADPAWSQIVVVAADGSTAAPMATAETLLDNPTSLAFGTGKGDRKNLFIANYDLLSPDEESAWGLPVNYDGPALLKIGAGRPGNPLP